MISTSTPLRLLLVYLSNPRISDSEREKDITEAWSLVETLGNAKIYDLIVQKGPEHESTYIGHGKTEEILAYIQAHTIDVIVINGNLKPRQKFNLLKLFWDVQPTIRVWDRVDLILEIFSRHARSTEAKLQILQARMISMGPRIYGMGQVMSQQGGGIGTRGIGETNTELMLRHWKREIKKIKNELLKLTQNRQRQIENRKQAGLQTISIVGYTNAGKTSLFNLLTHKKQLVENKLFATLDSTVGEIYMPELSKEVLISDTIGFIANLPPSLIEAFTSTLLESVHADIILHVADTSDPDIIDKISVVRNILRDLNIPIEKEIMVWNKIDISTDVNNIKSKNYAGLTPHVFISTKTKVGIDNLIGLLAKKLA